MSLKLPADVLSSPGVHQPRTVAAATEAAPAAALANIAALVVTASDNSVATIACVSGSVCGWASGGQETTLRSRINSSNDKGLVIGVSMNVFFTMKGVGYS